MAVNGFGLYIFGVLLGLWLAVMFEINTVAAGREFTVYFMGGSRVLEVLARLIPSDQQPTIFPNLYRRKK